MTAGFRSRSERVTVWRGLRCVWRRARWRRCAGCGRTPPGLPSSRGGQGIRQRTAALIAGRQRTRWHPPWPPRLKGGESGARAGGARRGRTGGPGVAAREVLEGQDFWWKRIEPRDGAGSWLLAFFAAVLEWPRVGCSGRFGMAFVEFLTVHSRHVPRPVCGVQGDWSERLESWSG